MKKSSPDYLTADEWHIYHVSKDPEFLKELGKINETENLESYVGIARKYLITRADVDIIKNEVAQSSHVRGWISSQRLLNRFVIFVSPDITKDEFLELWKRLSEHKKLLPNQETMKRKPPVNHRLIYAIFKQEQKSIPFQETFDLYKDRKLPYYIGEIPNDKYLIKDDLRHYYDSHKPDIDYAPELA